jgi:hypothetical protein
MERADLVHEERYRFRNGREDDEYASKDRMKDQGNDEWLMNCYEPTTTI